MKAQNSMKAPRCLLVTPGDCVNPQTGGGQRSGLFYAALRQLGPTEVVVLGHRLRREEIEPCFPGHAGLHLIETSRFPHRRLGRIALLLNRIRRYARFAQEYRPDPVVQGRMREVLGSSPALVLYRYFPIYCLAGHGLSDAGRLTLCVDIDDRDDQRLLALFRQVFRSALAARLYQILLLPQLRRMMRRRLAPARLVWFSAEEDLAGMGCLPAAVTPNVPFIAPAGSGTAPSHCRDILFIGTYGHTPNANGVRWFLETCWPRLHVRFPDSRFRVAGSGDWARLAAEFSVIEGVDFIGRVESVAAEYAQARLVISPIFTGGGSKIKVIEACAFGRPVVATPHSVRGFGREIEVALPQSGTVEGFVALCSRYLEDEAAADALGSQLRALQQARFSRAAVEDSIVEQLRSVAATA